MHHAIESKQNSIYARNNLVAGEQYWKAKAIQILKIKPKKIKFLWTIPGNTWGQCDSVALCQTRQCDDQILGTIAGNKLGQCDSVTLC